MKFNFKANSEWSIENELRCFLIFKKLESAGFPRGMQSELCNSLAAATKLTFSTINAKVGNFKGEAGITNPSNASEATIYIYSKYGQMSLPETEALFEGYMLCKAEKVEASELQISKT